MTKDFKGSEKMPIINILKSVRFWLFALAIVLSGLLLLWGIFLKVTAPRMDLGDSRQGTLRGLATAFWMYKMDHGSLPSEAEFKDQVKEYLECEDMLQQVRYFRKGSSYVLIHPGSNGEFDTPQGYEALKNFKKRTDDIVEWSGRIR